ncbi:dTDP-4-amino-4,6-dideoxygalactose transaminase [Bryocella elongata]|uniref:dTDP-4-amino-4,6-dideoxygalactose transaminase n=2 Tax=Bryocella elongata TaxID=863522 RepID=A0A1H5VTE2_9BACT|nr:dTDP-4-amino-4,6-dideoxygalactose transaminase [Bryocella elongata]
MTKYRIPFNRPSLTGDELHYIADAIAQGHISGDGAFTKKCHALLKETLNAADILLTTSCTHALEIAALLLDIQPGDEFIVPSFTFVSTVNAFVLRGARPVFVDIRPDTLNLDEKLVEQAITHATRLIVPVHYAGVGCEMDVLMEIANTHNLNVVEDNAHGLFGSYKGKPLGTFGAMATQSFHETKNIVCGEGGALVINEPHYLERAEIIREKGTNRSRFLRGQVDKYTWVDIGSSYLPSDILAAFLYAQLEKREMIQKSRAQIWRHYIEELSDWATTYGIGLPTVPDDCEQPSHMFYLLMPSPEVRRHLKDHLDARGILAVSHYVPLHSSEMGRAYGGYEGQCPVTERVSECLLRLPFFTDMSAEEQNVVISAIHEFEVGSTHGADRQSSEHFLLGSR